MMFTTDEDVVTSRPWHGDADFGRMLGLLMDTLPISPVGFNWDPRRLEGSRFYVADVADAPFLSSHIQLWESGSGDLVAFVLSEGRGNAHLQVHPDYRYLEEDMLSWAEQNLAAVEEQSGHRQLALFAYEYDVWRQGMLMARGYQKSSHGGVIRHMRLGQRPLSTASLHPGYVMRVIEPEDVADCQRLADLLNAAFNRDFHNAEEYQNYTRFGTTYKQDLDLVAVTDDGTFASYAALTYDAQNKRGTFEPVCTHPDHRQRGLAQALMRSGLARLRDLGGVEAVVETGDMIAANALYNSLGFTEMYKGYYWWREIAETIM